MHMLTADDIRRADLARLAELQNQHLLDQLKSRVISVVFPGGGGAAIDVGAQPSVTTSSYTDPGYTRAVADDSIKSGFAYLDKADYDQAIADFSRAIALNPDSALAHHGRGLAYQNKDDYDQAIADYNRATEIDPTDALAYRHRGFAYLDKADYDQAVADFSRAIEIDPTDVLYADRGLAYLNKADLDQAIADFSRAIALNPDSALAHQGRGLAYQAKAVADFNRATEIDPKIPRPTSS
jgi:tetratricopeptide (TPR) repeat protein